MAEQGAGAGGRRPVILCILDGWGWREEAEANAVRLADTPTFDRLWASCPHSLLRTDGPHVGLPEGQFGNSEVGHMNIGAGRVVMQDLPRITAMLERGELEGAAPFRRFVEAAKAGSGRVHLLGLVSPGGVHAHQDHLVGVAKLLAARGFEVRVHAMTDGRDTPPQSGREAVARTMRRLADLQGVQEATISGRYFAMDRDKRWDRVERAWRAMALGDAPEAASFDAALAAAYEAGTGDEFVEPGRVPGYQGMADGDALLCVNFRADRVREILTAILDPAFDGFARERRPELAVAAGITSYSRELDRQLVTLVEPQAMDGLLGETVAAAGHAQLRMAETEKYPHVTFFLNGGEEGAYPGEERVMVPSPKVATYDLEPEMSAVELTDRLVERLGQGRFDLVIVNYANPDMVGHTGKLDAAIRAVATVDRCLGRVLEALRAAGGTALVTADHGNCELMVDPETGGPHTAHTTNPVPCLLVGGPEGARLGDGRLADIAPTLLALLGVAQPAAMTGRSLLR